VKKYRGQGEWKDELTVRMDFPVWDRYHFTYLIWCYVYAYINIVYLIYSSYSVRDKKQEIIGVGTMHVISCTP
jgi:hypothetical protein